MGRRLPLPVDLLLHYLVSWWPCKGFMRRTRQAWILFLRNRGTAATRALTIWEETTTRRSALTSSLMMLTHSITAHYKVCVGKIRQLCFWREFFLDSCTDTLILAHHREVEERPYGSSLVNIEQEEWDIHFLSLPKSAWPASVYVCSIYL